jgi:molybdate transport system substrate-binding protein
MHDHGIPVLRSIAAWVVALLVLPVTVPALMAGEVRVAAAANFAEAAQEIGARFEQATGHRAIFSFGSTGVLYAQITQDAPFEVFLAADQVRPEQAVAAGHGVSDSRFTYATGRLVLFSRDGSLVKDGSTLRTHRFTRLAIANPLTAPYGAAAVETLRSLAVYDALAPRIVQGNNIAQTYQFVATGNAELGFVALSQVARHGEGSRWIVPDHLHPAIAQDAVLLRRGADNEAARAFLDFLAGAEAAALKRQYGYGAGH